MSKNPKSETRLSSRGDSGSPREDPIEIRNPNVERIGFRDFFSRLQSGFWFRVSGFRGRWAILLLLILALAVPATARGETVLANDGKSYTGKVTVTAHEVLCVSPGINRTFAIPVVKGLELSGSERMEFELRKQKLPPMDAEAHYRLGTWLKSKWQHGLAQEFFTKATQINADHAGARRELGYVRQQDAWVYSPALHQQMMYGWIGADAARFHLELAQKLHELKLSRQEEEELRRVLQSDQTSETALGMLRPLLAAYQCKNRFRLPFEGAWMAVSGPNLYGHGGYSYMMNAWDFRKVDEAGRTYREPAGELKSHFTFEQPVYACADGDVYEVIGQYPDNRIGESRPMSEGNRVLIRHANGERSVLGHLQRGSIKVKPGDRVRQGQLIGLMGNSGRSASPHLHFAVFDGDGISLPVTFVDFDAREPAGPRHVESGRLELGKVYVNSFRKAEGKDR